MDDTKRCQLLRGTRQTDIAAKMLRFIKDNDSNYGSNYGSNYVQTEGNEKVLYNRLSDESLASHVAQATARKTLLEQPEEPAVDRAQAVEKTPRFD
jgi:hypothetical protein